MIDSFVHFESLSLQFARLCSFLVDSRAPCEEFLDFRQLLCPSKKVFSVNLDKFATAFIGCRGGCFELFYSALGAPRKTAQLSNPLVPRTYLRNQVINFVIDSPNNREFCIRVLRTCNFTVDFL